MKWRLFEQKLGKQLFSHHAEVDVDDLWIAIEEDVDRINRDKHKKRFGFWLFLWGGIIVVSTFVWAAYEMGASSAHQNSVLSITEDHLPKGISSIGSKDVKDINKITAHSLSVISSTKETNRINAKSSEHKAEHRSISPKPGIASSSAKGNHQNKSTTDTPYPFIHIEQQGKEKLSNQNTSGVNSSKLPTDDDAVLRTKEEANKLPPVAQSIKHWDQILIPTKQTLLTLPKRTLEHSSINLTEKLPLPYTDSKKSPWFLSLDGSIAFASRKLSIQNTGAPLAPVLKDIRNNTETLIETSALSLQVGRKFLNDKLELSTGIHYTQINERFEYEEILTIDSIYRYGVQAFVKTIDNELDTIYGLVSHERITSLQKTYFNKYRLIDIPILISYRFPLEHINLGVQAGIFANIRLSTEGQILDTDYTGVDISSAKVFKSSMGLSYFLGLPVEYAINDQLSIAMTPSIRFFPQSFSVEDYSLRQEYTIYGLRGSIKYNFGSR